LSGMWRVVKPALYKLRQEGRIPAPNWGAIASSGQS
jgi:hypothetical protein